MGRTACTEPQCLYRGDLYLFFTISVYLTINKPYDVIFVTQESLKLVNARGLNCGHLVRYNQTIRIQYGTQHYPRDCFEVNKIPLDTRTIPFVCDKINN